MLNKNKDIMRKDDAVQAIVIADTFGGEFVPISDELPLSLLPVINKPLIDYTLEFLALGGVEETFLFCCSFVDVLKEYINKCIKESVGWSLTMKVNIIVSESCRSFGDCLRDIDAKGLLRGSFVLLEPGTISNIKLLPLIKKHNEILKKDKGTAMTLIFQEAGQGQVGCNPHEQLLVAVNNNNRVLFHRKLGVSKESRISFDLEIFLDNPSLSMRHNLKDTHVAICSPAVLPLFSDNFDFQTKDDFVRGLLINEEILDSRIYCHICKGSSYGSAVTSWRMYQAINQELRNKWIYPLEPCTVTNRMLKNGVVVAKNSTISKTASLSQSVIGQGVTVGKNVQISDSYIFSNTIIEDGVIITHSVIGSNCRLKNRCKVTAGSILGKGVVLEKEKFVENSLIKATKPELCDQAKDKLGAKAFRLVIEDEDGDPLGESLARRFRHLHLDEQVEESEDDAFSDSDDEELSHTQSPLPDDTKLFFTEVIDSLTRGFEDKLLCDNLILEINSSRYAYNVTVKEVNFNVIKAILHMSFCLPTGPQFFSQFVRLLSYFTPILKNYIRNDSAMLDALQAVEDVAISNENVNEKWIMFVLKWFYDKDHINEDSIINWCTNLDKSSRLHSQVKPFTDWLQQAEEASSSEEASD